MTFSEFVNSNRSYFEKFIDGMHSRFNNLDLEDIIQLSNKMQVLLELLYQILNNNQNNKIIIFFNSRASSEMVEC